MAPAWKKIQAPIKKFRSQLQKYLAPICDLQKKFQLIIFRL